MEENKAKKPYNKRRHYHNHNNRKGNKPREDRGPEAEALAEAAKEPTARKPEKPEKVEKAERSERSEKNERSERSERQHNSRRPQRESSGGEAASEAHNEQKKDTGERRGNRHNRHGDRRRGRNRQRPEAELDTAAVTPEQKPVFTAADKDDTFRIESMFTDDAIEDDVPSIDPAELEEMDALADVMLIDGVDDVDLMAEESLSSGVSDEIKYEVIGVKFGTASKTYYFDPDCRKISFGEGVIVETARGDKYGKCVLTNTYVPEKHVYLPLRKVLRIANDEDVVINAENIELADAAFKQCNVKIAEHRLEMKLIDAAYTHDRSKLVFFFTAPTRVDFRELVKDLAAIFKTRIDLRQIGIRDEAKMIGGYGICGRPFCCCSFLPNFNQVSIKMAKDQNLSLNTGKLSGSCGRLMCCLKYEHQTYLDEAKLMPPIGSYVRTPDGNGTVLEISPVAGTLKVRVSEDKNSMPKVYKKSDVTVLKRGTAVRDGADEEEDKFE
jgi:cell fate regulator YaaT (PSP1 superfamily)